MSSQKKPTLHQMALLALILSFVVPYFTIGMMCAVRDLRRPQRQLLISVYRRILPLVLFNLLCVQLPMVWAATQLSPLSPDWTLRPLELARLFLAGSLAFEVAFYSIHRAFHSSRRLYLHIHSVHHQLRADTVALGAIYCHPVEHAIANIAPALLVFPLLGKRQAVNFLSACIWSAAIATMSTLSHGGFTAHTLHHESNIRKRFGFLGLLDWWCGTN